MKNKPNLFIVGESKSGTTALWNLLNQHPDVYMAPFKEPCHFNTDHHEEAKKFHGLHNYTCIEEEKYLDLFKEWDDEKYGGEASVHYAPSKEAAKNIKQFNPQAKIIIMFREPVAFLHSLHNNKYNWLFEDVRDFQKAIELESERKQGNKLSKRAFVPSFLYYSERIKYSEHLQRFVKAFGSKKVYVIVFEEFRKDNEKIFTDVCRFLGIKQIVFEKKDFNPSLNVRFPRLRKTLDVIGLPKILKRILPQQAYNSIIDVYRKLFLEMKPRTSIDEDFRNELKNRCRPEVIRLERYLRKHYSKSIDLKKIWGY